MMPRITLAICTLTGLSAAEPQGMVKRLKTDLAYLAGPECQGRGNGQEGLNKAAAYAVATFKKLGLKTEIQLFPHTVRVDRERASAALSGKALELGKEVDFSPMSGSGNFQNAPVVFAGYGLSQKDYDDLAGVEVRGRVVAIGTTPPGKLAQGLDPRAAAARWKALADRGAVGIILLSQETNRAGGRGMRGGGSLPILSMASSTLPGAQEALKAIEATGRPQSGLLPNVTLSVDLALKPVIAQVPNVVAVIPGRDPKLKAEYLAVGAHLDHLGTRTGPDGQEVVHWGADDNGSGSVAVLEMGRQLVKNRPRRSVLLMLYGGEEVGLVGSRFWVNNPTVPIESVKYMHNFDMVGRLQRGTTFTYEVSGIPKDRMGLFPTRTVRGVTLGATFSAGGGGSDHASFLSKRIPAAFMITGMHPDYHRPSDSLEKIDFEGIAAITRYTADLIVDLGNKALPRFEPRPSLGFQGGPERGYAVGRIPAGSSAEAAGLREGDLITGLNAARIRNATDFRTAMDDVKVGQEITLRWTRDNKPMEAKVLLKEK